MSQQVKEIKVSDLVLWTENPRDPISPDCSDKDVVNHALADKNNKWNLNKLAKEMGEYYDYSELPTVVYMNGKPVVYDGNRRIILAKIKLGLVKVDYKIDKLPLVPKKIPCNVCSEEIALKNVYRKHADSGTWNPLERDIFLYKYMNQEKSSFVIIDEQTGGYITSHPELNKVFVKNEIFNKEGLGSMGFTIENGILKSQHSTNEIITILDDLSEKIKNQDISTRVSRGQPYAVLNQRSKDIIEANKPNQLLDVKMAPVSTEVMSKHAPIQKDDVHSNKKTRISKAKQKELFDQLLILKQGNVNDLYSDIRSFYHLYLRNISNFSPSVWAVFRMAMRLLCETASSEAGFTDIKSYLNQYYPLAKNNMDSDTKTYLANQNVNKDTMPQLLHTGAHNYSSSNNKDQALAISIALGKMLLLSHGKK